MATYYIDTGSLTNGAGTEGDPKNTTVGLPAGSHAYLLKRGTTLRETITVGGNNASVTCYGDPTLPLPVIDCENTRASGIFMGSAYSGLAVSYVRFVNQNATTPYGCVVFAGHGGSVRYCEFANARIGVGINQANNCVVELNNFDIGNPLNPTGASAVRINVGIGASGNVVQDNYITSTAAGMVYQSAIEMNGGTASHIRRNKIFAYAADSIILLNGASGNYITSNVCAGYYVKCPLSLESCNDNFVYFNVAYADNQPGEEAQPAFQLGNTFGAGAGAAGNEVKNNIFITQIQLPLSLYEVGAGNVLDSNIYYRYNGVVAPTKIVSTLTASVYTFQSLAEFQAMSQEGSGTHEDPRISLASFRPLPNSPLPGSPLIGAGTHLGYTTDLDGHQRWNPPTIGAYEFMRDRDERT